MFVDVRGRSEQVSWEKLVGWVGKNVTGNSSGMQDKGGDEVPVPQSAVGDEGSVDREGSEAPGILDAQIEWTGNAVGAIGGI